MGPFEMVVAIILIVTVGKIISAKQKAKHGSIEDEDMLGNKTQRLIGNTTREGCRMKSAHSRTAFKCSSESRPTTTRQTISTAR